MTSHAHAEVAALTIGQDAEVFTARQLGRELATAMGLDRLDATRMATAISELAREAAAAGGGRLTFAVSDVDMVVTLDAPGLRPDNPSLTSAERLVDSLTLVPRGAAHETSADGAPDEQHGSGTVVVLVKSAPATVDRTDPTLIRAVVAAHAPTSPLDELREQNHELLTVLDTVRAKNVELETLNRELEETNHGVMALYTELSDELERTNQGVVALYAEIDDKNEQLMVASEAKSRFLRSISHELRTPANSVLGLTRLLLDPGAAPLSSEQAEQVQYIRTSADDLLGLVNELLDLAKAESGRLDPVVTEVDVDSMYRELAGMVSPLLRDGVQLLLDPGPDGLHVRTDPDLLRHVLRNLLSNAAKFTTGGTIHLTTTIEGDTLVVTVTDTGVGMSEEDRGRVFEEFFQARTPLHADAGGTGLGLPFALRVAQALGGTITVDSAPGEGSSFAVRLPIAGEDQPA